MDRKKVIFVTDGDLYALHAVESVARDIGGRCISHSWGNPSKRSGEELIKMILSAPADPVLVMFDDCGYKGEGPGERAMREIASCPEIEVLGAIAVAAKTKHAEWANVNVSIDRNGNLTEYGIDKSGLPDIELGRINGDTVYILDELNLPIVIGVGDIGKMAGYDSVEKGSPITRMAVQLILERSHR
ncbi:stage V sporulation protein AE [Fictibacillus aquaticus]|uniref:Stage V sporulation protein AE n=1 Tax=Fictibacillus aquaticus TaxID=2021314 RepID=A0A235FAX2_9BACL|nr:stage V sporulation protein AE [Fictibacillus aquaticus]OYD58402.1 stage V sporulation protein AE [Fictibacillus aquaticus]